MLSRGPGGEESVQRLSFASMEAERDQGPHWPTALLPPTPRLLWLSLCLPALAKEADGPKAIGPAVGNTTKGGD